MGPGGTAITGVVFGGIAVFTFDSITVGGGGRVLILTGPDGFTDNGVIDVSGGTGHGSGGGNGDPGTVTVVSSPAPEPSTLALLGLGGALALLDYARRCRKRVAERPG
jgi:hypothetical protein